MLITTKLFCICIVMHAYQSKIMPDTPCSCHFQSPHGKIKVKQQAANLTKNLNLCSFFQFWTFIKLYLCYCYYQISSFYYCLCVSSGCSCLPMLISNISLMRDILRIKLYLREETKAYKIKLDAEEANFKKEKN